MNKTPILSLLFALLTISVANPLLTSCDDDDESKVYILEKEIEAGLLADNSVVIDTTCVTATIQGKMLHEEKLNDIFDLTDTEVGIQYIKEEDFIANKDGQLYWHSVCNHEATLSDFKFQLSFLEPGTSYLYRIYVNTHNVTLFGDAKQFTTHTTDRYLNLEVVEQGFLSMKFAGVNRLEGVIGEIPENEIRMYYRTGDQYFSRVYPIRNGDSLSLSLTDVLSPGLTYEYYIEAHGTDGEVRTPVKTFSTRNPADYIYVDEPSEITATTAVISGYVDTTVFKNYNEGEPQLIETYYSTDKNSFTNWDIHTQWSAVCWTKNNEFKMELKDMLPGTTYYYKVRATWRSGYFSEKYYYNEGFFSEIRSFTTN